MSKYDGWVLKVTGKKPRLCIGFIHSTRKEVINQIEGIISEPWKKYRLRGGHKIVKVILLEVPNSNSPSRG